MNSKRMHPVIRIEANPRLATHVLAKSFYPTWLQAFLEIFFNGEDSARRRGVVPRIDVRFYKKGEHPLSPKGPAAGVTDNGTGFTAQVIRDYTPMGLSASAGHKDLHGVHGVGIHTTQAASADAIAKVYDLTRRVHQAAK